MAESDNNTPATDDPAVQTPDAGSAETEAWPDRYFQTSDGVLARLGDGGWRSQVYHPSKGEWVDYPDLDVAGECTEIPEQQALAMTSGPGEFAGAAGEFGPEGDGTEDDGDGEGGQ